MTFLQRLLSELKGVTHMSSTPEQPVVEPTDPTEPQPDPTPGEPDGDDDNGDEDAADA